MPDAGEDYRAAKAAVVEHVRRWADAEIALVDWLRTKRGVPSHVLFDRATGEPLDSEHRALSEAVDKAEADSIWCRGLVVACGEVVKGCTFAKATQREGVGG